MVSRRTVLAAGAAAVPAAYLADRNPLVPEQTIVGTGPGSGYYGPLPRGESIGTYNYQEVPHASFVSHAGKVEVFVVTIDPTAPAGAWEAVPPTGQAATVSLPGDGSLIVTWGTPGTAGYGQHGFAETIWQEWTVNEAEPPPSSAATRTPKVPNNYS